MPEGDTIYRTARALQKALGGKVVTGFETGLAKLTAVDDESPLVGRVVERVEARGKWCLIFFSGDLILVTHMLMSGSWHIYRVGEKWRLPQRRMRVMVRVGGTPGLKPKPFLKAINGTAEAVPLQIRGKADGAVPLREWGEPVASVPFGANEEGVRPTSVFPTHARKDAHEWATRSAAVEPAGYEAVAFNVPIAEFYTARSLERSLQVPKLGPDVLGEGFSVEVGVKAMRERAASHPEDEVGVVLLNQRVMAGLGNVYKSEVAFAAGVNPFRQMRTVTEHETRAMVEFAQRYMKANVVDGGPRGETGEGIVTYTGLRRTTRAMKESGRLWVYRRAGEECRRCGAAVLMRKQGVQARSTYWCPVCQPWVG